MEDFITLLAILLLVLVFAIKSRGVPECVGLIGCAQACRLFLRQEDHSFRVLTKSGRSEGEVMGEVVSTIVEWADGLS